MHEISDNWKRKKERKRVVSWDEFFLVYRIREHYWDKIAEGDPQELDGQKLDQVVCIQTKKELILR